MDDFIDSLITLWIGLLLGMLIGMIALGVIMDKKYQKFCPQCGQRWENEENYCPNDGTELLTIGG